jgi:S-DNA-T family DNA segregation ATPase FtsK/SpoIIIE
VSLLQRRLAIGYARASRIIEMMAAAGVLGEYKGSQAREVLITLEEYERLCAQMQADAEASSTPAAAAEAASAEQAQDEDQPEEDEEEETSSESTYTHQGGELSASGKGADKTRGAGVNPTVA